MPPALIAVLVVAAVAALVALVLVWLRGRLRDAGVYVIPRTKFGPALVFTVEGDDGEPVRVLNVGGMYQSATYLDERYAEPVFEYYKLFDCMFEADLPVRNVLMIGGGGYAYPKHLVATRPDSRIDVVEVDPKITQVAQRYFFLDRLIEEYDTETTGRLALVTADGRAYLDDLATVLRDGSAGCADGAGGIAAAEHTGDAGATRAAGRARAAGRTGGAAGRTLADLRECYGDQFGVRYDAIVNDSFGGKEPAPTLATLEAAQSAHACLVDGGLYVMNVVAALEGDDARFMHALVATLGQVFKHVHVIPCGQDAFADRDNNIVVATDGPHRFAAERPFAPRPDAPVLTDHNNPVKELTR